MNLSRWNIEKLITLINPKNLFLLVMVLSLSISWSPSIVTAASDQPVVRAVLFFSPTCGHCHKVIEEDLPPLIEKYGDQLEIILVNVTTPEGRQLFQSAAAYFIEEREIRGVPTLVIGDQVLIGSVEIPEQLPGIIDAGLAQSGIDWPDLPGLSDMLQSQTLSEPINEPETEPAQQAEAEASPATAASPTPVEAVLQTETDTPLFVVKFLQDPIGNSVSVIVLIGMIICVIVVGYNFLRLPDETDNEAPPTWLCWPGWVIPMISLVGLAVAGYMSYVEVTQVEAICGPVGDCNTVQQSAYATLWGVLPVGVLGMFGYVSIGLVWLLQRNSKASARKVLALLMWGMALLGTLFSIYLTFLEPFIIGATCAWCITSAILITLLFLATTGPALQAMAAEEETISVDYA